MARKRVSESPAVVSTGAAPAPVRRKIATKRTVRPVVEDSNIVEPAVAAAAAAVVVEITAPSHEDIAHLAYSFWVARGCQGGSQEEDWLRAEQQLIAQSAK